MLPILSALAKVALSPLLFLLKYNRHICLCDNLFSLILWIVTGYITAQRSLEAQLAVFRRVHHAERSSEKSFPSWLRNKCPSLVYEVVAIESTDGSVVALHVVKPAEADGAVLVCFHGGGCVTGSPLDLNFKAMVERYGRCCTLVAPDYRLAIEGARWPAAVEDCMAAVRHCARLSKAAGGKLLLTGASAGGYLTMACALRAKAEGLHIHHLLPVAPSQHIDADSLPVAHARSPLPQSSYPNWNKN